MCAGGGRVLGELDERTGSAPLQGARGCAAKQKKEGKKPKQRDRAPPGEAVEPCVCRHRLFAASRGRGSSVPPPHFSGPMADRDVTH